MKKGVLKLFSGFCITCLCITFMQAQNVGIGTSTPAEKLHVTGNIRSDNLGSSGTVLVEADNNGTLQKKTYSGNSYDVLKGDGTWGVLGARFNQTRGTTNISKSANSGYTDMPGMSITFTPQKSTVVVHFSAGGTYGGTATGGQFASFRLVVNGVPLNGHGTSTTVGEYDDITAYHNVWGAALTVPVSVTPGNSTTIKIQWDFQSTNGGNTIYNYASTQDYSSRSLVIIE